MFEEPNIKIYGCVNGDIDRCKAEVSINLSISINLDIGLFKYQLLLYLILFCARHFVDIVKERRPVILNLALPNMSLVLRKPAFCICQNKDADQLRGNRKADQRLCFRYMDSTISLLPKSEISSL